MLALSVKHQVLLAVFMPLALTLLIPCPTGDNSHGLLPQWVPHAVGAAVNKEVRSVGTLWLIPGRSE